ncbi:hypothetical protein D3C84_826120 [compost metagenome]
MFVYERTFADHDRETLKGLIAMNAQVSVGWMTLHGYYSAVDLHINNKLSIFLTYALGCIIAPWPRSWYP